MHLFLKRILPLLAGAFLLASCNSYQGGPTGEMSFTRYQPIYLDVSMIENADEYKSPMTLPNVEHLMPFSPTEAMHIWVKDRLRAVGGDKTLQVIIKDASVIETKLPKPGGFTAFFTVHQDKRYDAKLSVEMRIYGEGDAMSLASITANVTRSVTMSESASAAERDAVLYRLTADMMEQMNAELEKNIFQYFGSYISYSHNS